MVNDSGVFVPHIRSFPGTSNLQHPRPESFNRTIGKIVVFTGLSLDPDVVLVVYVRAC